MYYLYSEHAYSIGMFSFHMYHLYFWRLYTIEIWGWWYVFICTICTVIMFVALGCSTGGMVLYVPSSLSAFVCTYVPSWLSAFVYHWDMGLMVRFHMYYLYTIGIKHWWHVFMCATFTVILCRLLGCIFYGLLPSVYNANGLLHIIQHIGASQLNAIEFTRLKQYKQL